MPFKILVDDNFHYGDGSERWEAGTFGTEAQALEAAREIVVRSLRELMQPGMSADELISQYCLFGDDPFIVPQEGPRFSARDYAREAAMVMCRPTQST